MSESLETKQIAVIGLGYVGLPVAIALAKKHKSVFGFDIQEKRIAELKAGHDRTNEVDLTELKNSTLGLTSKIEDIKDCNIFVIAVPTPIDGSRQPDLRPVISASKTVAKVLKKGDIVVYESTVYPGVTEDICGPVLAEGSGLRQSKDFFLGYSPERINPGDKEHTFENIVKVVSGDTSETLEIVATLYETVVTAGVHRAPTIKVAEAAKVIENTQRDLNIALMNELAIIFERINIRTADVLAAAGTKWNFLPFTPGLVGGHCIGVDPYYLTAKAEELGYHPQVILSGRRINDGMGAFICQKLIKMLAAHDRPIRAAKIGILGLSFKENVPDFRNSRVPDIIKELAEYGISPYIHDPLVDAEDVCEEYGINLCALENMPPLDAIIITAPHREYLLKDGADIFRLLDNGGIVVDVKSAFDPNLEALRPYHVWSL